MANKQQIRRPLQVNQTLREVNVRIYIILIICTIVHAAVPE